MENGGSIKLKFKKWGEDNNAFDFDDQFPVIIEIAGIPMFLTEVYVKKNGFRMVLLDYDDVVISIFQAQTRAFYDLENLWEAPRMEIDGSKTQIKKLNKEMN